MQCLKFLDLKLKSHLKSWERRRLPHNKNPKIDFASNDYLGFAKDPKLYALFCKKLQSISQLGSTGSRLLTGNSHDYEELEGKIAAFHREEAGLIFSSGYMANIGLISSLANRDDTIIYDEKVHASMRDGIILSRARNISFRHNDVDDLKRVLKRCPHSFFVLVESIYSTDGSFAPLQEMANLCSERLIVDEAHATGVFGSGLVKIPVLARVHTFSKALGVQGAIVLGSRKLIDYLVTKSRSFIYSTALSIPNLAAIECAYHYLHEKKIHFPFSTPIQAIVTKNAKQIAQLSTEFDLRALLYPTVPRGEECIRICFHSFNTKDEIKRLYAWIDHHRD